MDSYDTIVVGVGGMGSATLYELARRGQRVLGIEQFGCAHARGSSHGQTRIIRRAYFEHPDYVPLVTHAIARWRQLETATGAKLLEQTGLLLIGAPETQVIRGARLARSTHALPIEEVSVSEFGRRFAPFRREPEDVCLFESDAGFLRVEQCVTTCCQAALDQGAQLHTGETVRRWHAQGDDYLLHTDRAAYHANTLVFTAGAWTSRIAGDVGLPLQIRRKVQLWFRCDPSAHALERGAPIFGYATMGGFFYGFPALEPGVLKVAEHSGLGDIDDPGALNRDLTGEDLARVTAFIQQSLPCVTTELVRHSACMYTMTPDEHFLVDRHPAHARVFVAAGFSGHGFKFAPVVAEIMADWIVSGMTELPCEFLQRQARPQAAHLAAGT